MPEKKDGILDIPTYLGPSKVLAGVATVLTVIDGVMIIMLLVGLATGGRPTALDGLLLLVTSAMAICFWAASSSAA